MNPMGGIVRVQQRSVEHAECGVACVAMLASCVSESFRSVWLCGKSDRVLHPASSFDQRTGKAGLRGQTKAVSFMARNLWSCYEL